MVAQSLLWTRALIAQFSPSWARIAFARSSFSPSTFCFAASLFHEFAEAVAFLSRSPCLPLTAEKKDERSQFSPDGESLGTASPCPCWREGSEPGRLAQPHPRFVPS